MATLEEQVEAEIDHWCDTGAQSLKDIMDKLRPLLSNAKREERLKEAKWWHEWGAEKANCPKFCLGCKRLAAMTSLPAKSAG